MMDGIGRGVRGRSRGRVLGRFVLVVALLSSREGGIRLGLFVCEPNPKVPLLYPPGAVCSVPVRRCVHTTR
jgi:hypothetical protein